LVSEIRHCLPASRARLYHGSPAWLIGENGIVGVNVKTRAGVTLLFWNGQALEDQSLTAVGQFKAAQISFQSVSEIDARMLRRLLKKPARTSGISPAFENSDAHSANHSVSRSRPRRGVGLNELSGCRI
jgi:hypothetical protein